MANLTLQQIAAQNAKSLINRNRSGSNTSPHINGAQGSTNTISMGNLQPLTSITLSGLNDIGFEWHNNSANVKKYEVFETSEDILALSVTWHRLRPLISHGISNIVNPSNRPTKLTDEILFKEMIQEDRDRADVIRDYYSKKLMILTLKDHRMSNYRKDLNTFIHGDCKIVKEEMMPLVYRLPEFYDYDIEVENMFRDLDTRFDHTIPAFSKIVNLEPIKKLTVNGKSKKFVEYWLKDSSDRPYKLEIEISNQLMHLWDHFFDKGSVLLDVVTKPSNRDGASFYKLIKWNLA